MRGRRQDKVSIRSLAGWAEGSKSPPGTRDELSCHMYPRGRDSPVPWLALPEWTCGAQSSSNSGRREEVSNVGVECLERGSLEGQEDACGLSPSRG